MNILILGPLPDQFQHMKRRLRDLTGLDLRYLDKDKNLAHASGCGHAIMTRHCHHRHYHTLSRLIGDTNVHLVSSGISAVVNKVREIHSKHQGE